MLDASTAHTIIILMNIVILARSSKITYSICEEQPPPVFIGNLYKDLNLEHEENLLKNIDFSINFFPMQQVGVQFFRIDNFVLLTNKKIDRESVCKLSDNLKDTNHACKCLGNNNNCSFTFTISNTPFDKTFSIYNVVIFVKNLNDHLPTFVPNVFSVYINEDSRVGSKYVIPKAEDADNIVNEALQYVMSPKTDIFSLNVSEGVLFLTLIDGLDRERIERYDFRIFAIDQDIVSNTGVLSLQVFVEDINDCFPQFLDNKTKNFAISERTLPGYVVYTARAIDHDKGGNGFIQYSLLDSERGEKVKLFSINDIKGYITLEGTLDRESLDQIILTIIAKDLGSPSKTSSMTIKVKVLDVNDNAPSINIDPVLLVSENKPIGTLLTSFIVEDLDLKENSTFDCFLHTNSSDIPFSLILLIDHGLRSTFKIITTSVLDREKKSFYNFILRCEDKGKISLSSEAKVLVLITDDNDHAPTFTNIKNFSTITLPENVRFFLPVICFKALDPDIKDNGALVYEIVDKELYEEFYLNSSSGCLFVNKMLDYEERIQYTMTVKVKDLGTTSLSSVVLFSLNVINENDNPPVIFNIKDNQIFMLEDVEVNSVIYEFKVADLDGENSSKKPEIYLLYPDRNFSIKNHCLRTSISFDRETRDKYSITVVARDVEDHKLTSLYNIDVIISDVNDCVPNFLFPSKDSSSLLVSNLLKRGSTVVQVSARDQDAGVNSVLQYSLHNHLDTLVSIPLRDTYDWRRNLNFKKTDSSLLIYPCPTKEGLA